MYKILILAVLAVFCKPSTAADFCGLPSCGGATHIDCIAGAEGTWGSSCPADKVMLNLRDVQETILDIMNTYRNNIAGGKVSGFQPATCMAMLEWNVTLANLARENVRQCQFKPDACVNTNEFAFAGQNIGYYKYSKTQDVDNIDILTSIIQAWYAQISQATMADMNAFPGDSNVEDVCQLLHFSATQVGCAADKLTLTSNNVVLFTCNFNMANIKDWPTYLAGPTASKCTTGTDSTYTNLCSDAEVYDFVTFWNDPHYQ